MIRTEKKLTAAEVKTLPAGTEVQWHGYDRRGIPTWLECTIIQCGKSKKLRYYGSDDLSVLKPIRDMPNKYFTLKER